MKLSAVTWFEIEKHPNVLNSLLLFFDDIFVPNTLWLETGSKFEDIFIKMSPSKNEIYDVVVTPVFLGGNPEQQTISFSQVYGPLPIERKEHDGVFIQFFEVLHAIDQYPPIFKEVISAIFDAVNQVSPFQDYNRFTYEYAPLINKGLSFIEKRETRGDESSYWLDNFRDYYSGN